LAEGSPSLQPTSRLGRITDTAVSAVNVGEAEPGGKFGKFGMVDPASQVLAGRC
jgi:hypothetical protein